MNFRWGERETYRTIVAVLRSQGLVAPTSPDPPIELVQERWDRAVDVACLEVTRDQLVALGMPDEEIACEDLNACPCGSATP